MKDLKAYEYLEPASCSFVGTPLRPANDNLCSIYLASNFSSGSIYIALFEDLPSSLLHDKADSTFYIRYLDLDILFCHAKLWVKGGRYGKGLQAEDVEAVPRYAWFPKQVCKSRHSVPKASNYAR